MVRHQTPCIQLKPADFSVMVEKEKKSVIVLFLFKNTLPVNSAQYNMINTRTVPCVPDWDDRYDDRYDWDDRYDFDDHYDVDWFDFD